MTMMLPPARPAMDRAAATSLLTGLAVDVTRPALLGRRGYFRDTMGRPGVNDINLYDDAIMLVSPTTYLTFNANTDPSRSGGAIATLAPGVWRYKIGIHGLSRPVAEQYTALVQAAPVTVLRDNGVRETGWFGINIHRGGYTTTSSLGCQTIWPEQFAAFLAAVEAELRRYAVADLPYALTEYADEPNTHV